MTAAAFADLVEREGRRIARLKEGFLAECPDGVVRLPFACCSCGRRRYDFEMLTGDGLPLCQDCFGRCVRALDGSPAPPA